MTASARAGGGCDRVLGPDDDLQLALGSAADGAVLGLRPGRYPVNLEPVRSVSFVALGAPGEAVMDGGGRGPVLAVQADGIQVRLQGLTLTGGASDVGGAVRLSGFSEVHLSDCLLEGNRSGQGPGGAVFVSRGDVELVRCRVRDCPGQDGVALAIGGVGGLVMRDSLLLSAPAPVAAGLRVRDDALVQLVGSTLVADGAAAVSVAATASQRPTVTLVGCVVQGQPSLRLRAAHVGKVTVGQSVLSSPALGVYKPDGTVKVADPLLSGADHRPSPVSPARGLYASASGLDLLGRERRAHGATAGAIEA